MIAQSFFRNIPSFFHISEFHIVRMFTVYINIMYNITYGIYAIRNQNFLKTKPLMRGALNNIRYICYILHHLMLSNKNHLKLITFDLFKLHNFAITFLYLYVFKYFVEQTTLRVSLDKLSYVCFNVKCIDRCFWNFFLMTQYLHILFVLLKRILPWFLVVKVNTYTNLSILILFPISSHKIDLSILANPVQSK